MTTVEQRLYETLKERPDDWDLRTDLAEKLVQKDEAAQAAETIGGAPEPPPTEYHALKVLEICGDAAPDTALEQVRAFLIQYPESPAVQMACARMLASHARAGEAVGFYRHAVTADPEMRDAEMERWLKDTTGIVFCEEEDEGEGAAGTFESEDVTPIEAARISSLRQRRKEETTTHSVRAIPLPSAVRAPDAIAGGAAPRSLDDLHAAEAHGISPAPSMHVIDEHTAEVIHQQAMERTGLHTADHFGIEDIKRLQSSHSNTREKVSALTVAVLLHVVVFFVLGLIVIAVPRALPPQIVAVAGPTEEVVIEVEKKEVQKVTKPNPSTASRVDVVSVANASAVAVPIVVDPVDTIEPIGLGNDFGMAMSFSAQGAGNISFFGSQAKASKVVFVVDSSASMNAKGQTGLSKHELMKQELIKTVKGLSSGVEYQIIFFSGPCWFVGDRVPESRDKNDHWIEWVQNGKVLNFWHYKDGEDEQLPVGEYRQATPAKIRQTISDIEETPATYGTDWRTPLKMAMAMEPDVIYFMTDGAVGNHPSKPPVVEDVLKFNKGKSNAKINSICLMVPKATEMLRDLAEGTKGEFTLVLEDGTPLRGRELEKYEKEQGGGGKKK